MERTDVDDWSGGSSGRKKTGKTRCDNSRSHSDRWNRNVRFYLKFKARPNCQSQQTLAANPTRYVTDASGLHCDEERGRRASYAFHVRPNNERDSPLRQSSSSDTTSGNHSVEP